MPSTDLMTLLNPTEATFIPQWRQELSRQAGGTTRAADMGPALWMARLAVSVLKAAPALQLEALINAMDGAIGSSYIWNPRSPYPQSDPRGLILGASMVTIYDLGMDNKTMKLAGLPVGYVLTLGDFLSYDDNDNHRSLHQIVSASATADGSGRTATFEVRPHIRAGAETGLDVSLIKPSAEMFIIPGSYDSRWSGKVGTLSFEAMQVP